MSLERRIEKLEQRSEAQGPEADELNRLTDLELMAKSQKVVDGLCERAGRERVILTADNLLQVLRELCPGVLEGLPA